jgi:hypothetical protein
VLVAQGETMTLQDQARAVRNLQKQLQRGKPIEPTVEMIVLLREVADKLGEIQKFLDEMYEQSTGKSASQ